MHQHNKQTIGFIRLPEVLKLIPVGKSTWWAGVKDGRFPAPVKLGPRVTAWRREDIQEWIRSRKEGTIMKKPKEMPAPCKDEHINNFQIKSNKFHSLSQVDNWQPIGEVAARLLAKELRRQLIKNNSNGAAISPTGGADV